MWFNKQGSSIPPAASSVEVSVPASAAPISPGLRRKTNPVAGRSVNAVHASAVHVHYKEEINRLTETVNRLASKVEMLEAKEEAQKQLRELTNQKFDKLNEQIGEVRELFKVLSSEKKELEVKIGQTMETVKQVQPAQIAKQLGAFGQKISVIEGKIQLLVKQYDTFKKDFDHFNHKLKVFKGEDELIKLQQRVRVDLDDVSKISHQASMHASKIENHFVKINEKATAVANSIAELKALKEGLQQLQVELTKQSEAAKNGANSDELKAAQTKLADLEETVGGLADLTTETFTSLKKDVAELSKTRTSASGQAKGAIDPAEFEKMKKWVAYLIKTSGSSGAARK